MAGPDAAAGERVRLDRRWRRERRAALLLWVAFAIVVWNVTFDAVVIQSGRDYLTRQVLHQQRQGPSVTIPEVMRPGIRRGVSLASLCGGTVALCGLVGVWAAGRRRTMSASLPQ